MEKDHNKYRPPDLSSIGVHFTVRSRYSDMAPENHTQESDDHHSEANTDFLIRLARPVRANADGHFPVKASEEIEQLVGGEAAEVPVHQVRDFRLFDAEQRRDLTLLELPVCQRL